MPVDKEVTGRDTTLKFEGEEVFVSNVDWTYDTETTDVQLNDELYSTNVNVGIGVSGSFEYDGAQHQLHDLAYDDETGEAIKGSMTYTEETNDQGTVTYQFVNVKITSRGRSAPADGVISSTWDFSAQKLIKS